MVELRSRPRTTAAESTYSGFGTFNTDNELQITVTCNTYEGNTEESSTTQNSQWSTERTLRVMYGRVTESAQDYCSRIKLLRIWNF